ncbi:MAG: tRNA pseudouridine synthase TruD [Myxococcales bacterium]|nr:tRNA pseudouridine synthase TruD [Myxococcales bacterium]
MEDQNVTVPPGTSALPYLTADLPGTGGVLRTSAEDFLVDEEPAYLPSGTGDHVYVRIEKRGMTTSHAVERIARAVAVSPRDIGVAGMKDRHAVTRQWLSLPPPVTPEAVHAIAIPDLAILEIKRHGNKLRTGHVRANRFQLRVRGVAPDAAARATAILERLAAPPGAPNWYGEQRFGRDGDNAARGRAIVMGERPPRDRKLARLLVSSLQSQLFNDWLVARIGDGLYARALAGDILHKRDGGQFTCEDPATDEARLVAGELAVTGPMFGDRMRRSPEGTPAAEREDAILAAAGLTRDSFSAVRAIAEGTRRDATIEVRETSVVEIEPEVIEVRFTLPGGAYATAVMREVMKP